MSFYNKSPHIASFVPKYWCMSCFYIFRSFTNCLNDWSIYLCNTCGLFSVYVFPHPHPMFSWVENQGEGFSLASSIKISKWKYFGFLGCKHLHCVHLHGSSQDELSQYMLVWGAVWPRALDFSYLTYFSNFEHRLCIQWRRSLWLKGGPLCGEMRKWRMKKRAKEGAN